MKSWTKQNYTIKSHSGGHKVHVFDLKSVCLMVVAHQLTSYLLRHFRSEQIEISFGLCSFFWWCDYKVLVVFLCFLAARARDCNYFRKLNINFRCSLVILYWKIIQHYKYIFLISLQRIYSYNMNENAYLKIVLICKINNKYIPTQLRIMQ